jgi:hypothetical protein
VKLRVCTSLSLVLACTVAVAGCGGSGSADEGVKVVRSVQEYIDELLAGTPRSKLRLSTDAGAELQAAVRDGGQIITLKNALGEAGEGGCKAADVLEKASQDDDGAKVSVTEGVAARARAQAKATLPAPTDAQITAVINAMEGMAKSTAVEAVAAICALKDQAP